MQAFRETYADRRQIVRITADGNEGADARAALASLDAYKALWKKIELREGPRVPSSLMCRPDR